MAANPQTWMDLAKVQESVEAVGGELAAGFDTGFAVPRKGCGVICDHSKQIVTEIGASGGRLQRVLRLKQDVHQLHVVTEDACGLVKELPLEKTAELCERVRLLALQLKGIPPGSLSIK